MTKTEILTSVAIIFGLSWLAFYRAITAPFLHDDYGAIKGNMDVQVISQLNKSCSPKFFRPSRYFKQRKSLSASHLIQITVQSIIKTNKFVNVA